MNDRVAEAFRAARKAAGLKLQDVADRSTALNAENPALYSPVSKSLVSVIENEGSAYFRRNVHDGKLRSLIQILFGGDEVLFTQMTGIRVNVLGPEHAQPTDMHAAIAATMGDEARVPVYDEGMIGIERGEAMFGMQARERVHPDAPDVQFLVRATSRRMIPIAFPGQLVGARITDQPRRGSVMVIQRSGEGLVLAWAISDTQFLYQSGGEPWALRSSDVIVGEITHVRPYIPLEQPA